MRGGPSSSLSCPVGPPAVASAPPRRLLRAEIRFASWDQACPIVAGFSPACYGSSWPQRHSTVSGVVADFSPHGDVLLGYAVGTLHDRARCLVRVREVFELMRLAAGSPLSIVGDAGAGPPSAWAGWWLAIIGLESASRVGLGPRFAYPSGSIISLLRVASRASVRTDPAPAVADPCGHRG
jgi:hypothetical protein